MMGIMLTTGTPNFTRFSTSHYFFSLSFAQSVAVMSISPACVLAFLEVLGNQIDFGHKFLLKEPSQALVQHFGASHSSVHRTICPGF
jgi:hypothetical protein